jgi:hypothetical protein
MVSFEFFTSPQAPVQQLRVLLSSSQSDAPFARQFPLLARVDSVDGVEEGEQPDPIANTKTKIPIKLDFTCRPLICLELSTAQIQIAKRHAHLSQTFSRFGTVIGICSGGCYRRVMNKLLSTPLFLFAVLFTTSFAANSDSMLGHLSSFHRADKPALDVRLSITMAQGLGDSALLSVHDESEDEGLWVAGRTSITHLPRVCPDAI